jgi:catechol 2,3-dioxygenase-like lactoylglutathione lyase family enzyme
VAAGIKAITLMVEDLDTTKSFYREVPGLPVTFEDAIRQPFTADAAGASGPEDLDVIVGELAVRADECQPLNLGLGDEHVIEWIAMVPRKPPGLELMAVLDGQGKHTRSDGTSSGSGSSESPPTRIRPANWPGVNIGRSWMGTSRAIGRSRRAMTISSPAATR